MYQVAALIYLVWGGLHLLAAYRLKQMASSAKPGAIQGRLLQSAWNLMAVAIAVSVVAVLLNWQNSSLGYWLNLAMASVTDVGFIVFVLAPGYVPRWPGFLGPALWFLAALFSTLGLLGGAV